MIVTIVKPLLWLVLFLAGALHYNEIENSELVVQAQKIVNKVDPKQLACMTANIFYEAGREDIIGQAAVARVVMNRVLHGFASTPCEVVKQKIVVEKEQSSVVVCQFSWVCEEDLPPLNKNSVTYKNAERIAYEVLVYDGFKDVVPSNTLFFHNTSVNPNWPYKKVKKIGNHIFYSKQKSKHVKSTSK